MKGKRFLSMGLCTALVLTMVFASGCGDKEEPAATGDAAVWQELVARAEALAEMRNDLPKDKNAEYFVKQAVLIQEMEEFFERKTPYPIFAIIAAEEDAAGKNEEEALKLARFMVIREQAALWYAQEHDMKVTDDKVNQWLIKYDILSDEVLYQDACEAAGVSYETFARYMQRQYRMLYIMEMAYEADEKMNEEAMTAEYKESREYKKLDKLLENCADLVRSGANEDLDQILAADIWYEMISGF